jgi:hypothetical protein
VDVIHALLVLAAVLFVLWLLFHAAGGLINRMWLLIIIAVALWVLGFFFRGGRGSRTI